MPLNQIISPDRFIDTWEWGRRGKAQFWQFSTVWVIFRAITPSVFQEYALSLLSRSPYITSMSPSTSMSLSDNSLRNISKNTCLFFAYYRSLSLSLSILSTISSRNKLLEIPSFNLDAERGGKARGTNAIATRKYMHTGRK